jgi:1-acyl-sn-glycerol-3-phosphate acyltransferase
MLYSFLKGLSRFIFLALGLKVEGLNNFPRSGPVIVAANHLSNWDPIVVAVALPRIIYFIAKNSLFKYRFSNYLFTHVNAFPVKPDSASIRRSLQVLRDGDVLGIFPQGARDKSGNLKAQSGIALIALKSGAPIVPVACIGTDRNIPWGWGGNFKVRVGAPIYLEKNQSKMNSATLEQISTDIMNKINVLKNK